MTKIRKAQLIEWPGDEFREVKRAAKIENMDLSPFVRAATLAHARWIIRRESRRIAEVKNDPPPAA